MPDRTVAAQLARALEGEQTGIEEADRLAVLLRTATAPYRTAIEPEASARAAARLAHAAPAARRLRGPIAAIAVVTAAVAALVLLPRSHGPGVDVEAQAAVAIRRAGPMLRLASVTRVPGAGPALHRTQWTGSAGRTRVRVLVGGRLVEDVLREPGGRVIDHQAGLHRVVLAPSCAAVAGLCSELIDPVSFYRARLGSANATDVRNVRFAGRPAYQFTLPAQRLGGHTTTISQVVTLDAATFLPRRIVWLQRAGGRNAVAAVIDVRSIDPLPVDAPALLRLPVPRSTPVVQLDRIGRALGPALVRDVTVPQAAADFPNALWLGRSFHGLRLTRARAYSWGQAGSALRLDYGQLVLWNFSAVIPPSLVDAQVLPGKEVVTGGTPARFYVAANGRLVAERDLPGGTIAVVAPQLRKLDLFEAAVRVRRLAGR